MKPTARTRRSGIPILVFDGDCGFCTTSARFVRRWVDRQRRYEVRPWQQLDLESYGLTPEDCVEAAQFITAVGERRSGAQAIAGSLSHGAAAWRPFGLLIGAPGVRVLAAHVYTWVADHRYALPGGTPACAVPPKAG